MEITRTSELSGITHTREMPGVTQDRLDQCWRFNANREGKHIQDVFPELSADDREFLMTGITAEEWTEAFGSEDDQE